MNNDATTTPTAEDLALARAVFRGDVEPSDAALLLPQGWSDWEDRFPE